MKIKTFFLSEGGNWGDNFAPFLFSKLYDIELVQADAENSDLVATGSLIRGLPQGTYTGHVLGTGLMDWLLPEPFDLSNANVHMLRGKLTREHCKLPTKEEPPLGDLGILAYKFAPPLQPEFKLGILPHYVEKNHRQVMYWQKKGAHVIDIQSGMQNVIDEVCRCEKLVTSSLHGLVLADSLGIPNHLVVLHDSWIWGRCGFKFQDYYSVYDEVSDNPRSIDEAVELCRVRDTSQVKATVQQVLDNFVRSLTC